jgi:hypothetical protein
MDKQAATIRAKELLDELASLGTDRPVEPPS